MKSCLTCAHFPCEPILMKVNGTAQAEDCGWYEESGISRKCAAIIKIVREEIC